MSKARGLADLGNVYDDGALSNRNLIINGAMQVNQRGNLTGITSEQYFVDRFLYNGADEGTWSLSQSTDVPSGSGFTKSAKLEITTADTDINENDYTQLRYKVENQDIKHILKGTSDAKQLTLSFWVKSSLAQEFKFRIRENYSSTTRQIIKSFTVASANTWQKVTMTFDGDTGGDDFSGSTDTDSNFILEWMLGGGTTFQGGTASGNWEDFDQTKYDTTDTFLTTVNSTFYITGVQLEVGDTATPFEHRSYGDELARCQRYFEKIELPFSISATGHTARWGGDIWSGFTIPFQVPKRAQPTVSEAASGVLWRRASRPQATATNIGSGSYGSRTQYGVSVYVGESGRTNGEECILFVTTGDYIEVEAEL